MLWLITSLSLILVLIIVAATAVFLIGLSMIFINLKTKVPWVKTPADNLAMILDEIKLPAGSLVYDLGCGDGRFLFSAEQRGFRAIGYELSFYPYLRGLIIKYLSGSSVRIINRDYFSQDISDAKAVYVFLVDKVMAKIAAKLDSNLQPGTLVISHGFKIPDWPLEKTLATKPSPTYVYMKR